MAKPLVAIVGRPNVGKSTFFNKIAGRRISIVEDVPGVTRDRIYCDVEWMGRHFSMVDTGGLDMRSEDVLLSQMRRQAEIAASRRRRAYCRLRPPWFHSRPAMPK